jgi:hypothetical protein
VQGARQKGEHWNTKVTFLDYLWIGVGPVGFRHFRVDAGSNQMSRVVKNQGSLILLLQAEVALNRPVVVRVARAAKTIWNSRISAQETADIAAEKR